MKNSMRNVSIGGDVYRLKLISAEQNLRIEELEITPETTGIAGSGCWRIKKGVLHGGKQEGVDIIELDNGKLKLRIAPTRGMGILRAEIGDLRLGWDSPVKEVVHPCFVNLLSRGALGWLEGFNEWIVRCGLESAGAPGRDKFINNVGDEAEMDLTLHGKIANIPASEVEIVIEKQAPFTLRIIGCVFERMFYGPKLELRAEISTTPGSNTFRVNDTVINHGDAPQEFQLLYHINYGPPLLEGGARFVGAIHEVSPINARAAKDVKKYNIYAEPTPGFVEQVYCMTPYADSDGNTKVMLVNAKANRAAVMSYSIKQLPYLTLWKSTSTFNEGYVTGIEPATGFPRNRRIERKFGRVPVLKPGEERSFVIDYSACLSSAEVKKALQEIKKIQGHRKTKINTEPLPAE